MRRTVSFHRITNVFSDKHRKQLIKDSKPHLTLGTDGIWYTKDLQFHEDFKSSCSHIINRLCTIRTGRLNVVIITYKFPFKKTFMVYFVPTFSNRCGFCCIFITDDTLHIKRFQIITKYIVIIQNQF